MEHQPTQQYSQDEAYGDLCRYADFMGQLAHHFSAGLATWIGLGYRCFADTKRGVDNVPTGAVRC